jgi:hypothetical protein
MAPALHIESDASVDTTVFYDPSVLSSISCPVKIRVTHSDAYITGSGSSNETNSKILSGNLTNQWLFHSSASASCTNDKYIATTQFRVTSQSSAPQTVGFYLNGVPLVLNENKALGGFQIVVLDASTLKVKHMVQFDTYNIGDNAKDQMVSFLSAVDDHDIVGIAVHLNAGTSRSDLLSSLRSFGLSEEQTGFKDVSYAMIGSKKDGVMLVEKQTDRSLVNINVWLSGNACVEDNQRSGRTMYDGNIMTQWSHLETTVDEAWFELDLGNNYESIEKLEFNWGLSAPRDVAVGSRAQFQEQFVPVDVLRDDITTTGATTGTTTILTPTAGAFSSASLRIDLKTSDTTTTTHSKGGSSKTLFVFSITELRITSSARSLVVQSSIDFVHRLENTPIIDGLSISRGSTAGGTVLKIDTTFKSSSILTQSQVEVYIFNVPCDVQEVTSTFVQCKTGYHGDTNITHQGTYNVEVRVRGLGRALPSKKGAARYRYADFWSSLTTWGGKLPPVEGDLVHIPKGKTVILDISTPLFAVVVVEGTLEFDDSDPTGDSYIELNARYITVVGGTLQIGSEEKPYKNKATITLHGTPTDTELPMYGAKVLACRKCRLELHGLPTLQTWTRLSKTAYANSTTIELEQTVDWKVGSTIVIASTSHVKEEVEEVNVVGLLDNGKTVLIDRPLVYTHQGDTLGPFGDGHFMEIRAEVGLLSRNVVVQGDQRSSAWQFGATIMMFSPGDESLVAKIENIEVRNAGQAFRLGRYPIHFHMIGTVRRSYVRSNSVHHTFNRAVTIHGVHYLRIQNNVAYNVMGHTYFIEDAIETKNIIEYNLGILTKRSSALLNTDITPATFWITNPDNIVRHNAAAGSDNYGFWYR